MALRGILMELFRERNDNAAEQSIELSSNAHAKALENDQSRANHKSSLTARDHDCQWM